MRLVAPEEARGEHTELLRGYETVRYIIPLEIIYLTNKALLFETESGTVSLQIKVI